MGRNPRGRLSQLITVMLVAHLSFAFCASGRAQNQFSLSKPLSVRWQFETERTVNLAPALWTEDVYVPLSGGTVVCLKRADGTLNWKEEMGGEISASLAADVRGVYVAAEVDLPASGPTPQATGTLRSLSRQSGVTLWMRTLQAPIRGGLMLDQKALYGGTDDGKLYAIDRSTGEVIWSRQFHTGFSSPPYIEGERLYVLDTEGNLSALEKSSGQTAWRYRTRQAPRAVLGLAAQTIFLGLPDGYLYALREDGGQLRWRVRAGSGVQSLVPTQRGIVVTTSDNFVYLFAYRKGDRVWKSPLAGRVVAQPLVVGDSVLLSPLAGDECVILDLRNGRRLNSLPVSEADKTAAAPVLDGDLLLLTTRKGLVAYTDSWPR